MPVVESPLGVVRMKITDAVGTPSWITLNAAPPNSNVVHVVANEVGRLALVPAWHDLAVQTDIDTTFVYNGTPPSNVVADWQQIHQTNTFVVADEVERLAMTTVNPGDIVVQQDVYSTFVLETTPATDPLSWIQLPGGIVENEVFVLPDAINTPPPTSTAVSQLIIDTTAPLVSVAASHEVYVGPDDPRQGLHPNVLIWYDTTTDPADMMVWNPNLTPPAWVKAHPNYLPLAGGTLTGNLTFSGTNLGVNFTGGGGIYDWTDKPLTLRETTGGGQPKIINNDGSGGRDILDTAYVQAGTGIDINYLNGWTNADQTTSTIGGGGMQFRVSGASVSLWFNIKNGGGVSGNAASKVCAYPSGVPAPWQRLIFSAWSFTDQLTDSAFVPMEARSDGIYVLGGDQGYTAGRFLSGTISWTR